MITDPTDMELLAADALDPEALPDFGTALRQLLDPDGELVPGLLAAISDPRVEEAQQFAAMWAETPADRRRWLARRMTEAAEANFQMRYDRLFRLLLDDPEPEVRRLAVEGLWEDQTAALVERFAAVLHQDANDSVRAAAARALGPFVYRGELGELSEERAERATAALLRAARDEGEALQVRRRAVESVGYADRTEVHGLLATQFDADDVTLRAAAVCGMGRSADEQWAEPVIASLESPEPEVRYEAALAAGGLQLRDAIGGLVDLLAEDDREIQLAVIWALGEIGGRRAERVLERALTGAPDDEFAEAIEDALVTVALNNEDMPWGVLGG